MSEFFLRCTRFVVTLSLLCSTLLIRIPNAFAANDSSRGQTALSHLGKARSGLSGGALDVSMKAQPFSLLLVGIDRDPESPLAWRHQEMQADALVLLTARPETGVVDALHIPRDTRVVDARGRYQKINSLLLSSGSGGLKRAVEHLTHQPISAMMSLDFASFRRVMAHLGPLPFHVDRTVDSPEGVHVRKGWQRLSPQAALAVVRFRHEPLGDIGRIHRQSRFLRALIWHVGGLPYPVFAACIKLTTTDLTPGATRQLYDALQGLRAYHAHTVPGNFSVGSPSYWLVDEDAMAVWRDECSEEMGAVPALSHPLERAARGDADDGRDRSL
ncbi:LCP family protein [Ferroacidibacillus organovorans]|uniref:Cell envelope-related transcriptional attenuator domain-containing protein n=1 Tax=Ferroacidibacillus organovorans TaxID=1765683 RepID=A0A853KCT5_9BACL|nr:LCP family protein [Ferroacidibacillus organovorans]KYP81704.1 hypothetical protein AYJ22_06180 [Ferroacidibacillus organovorans]OAG94241.1 hypothetical protein AYW79_06390 [Ferroacidibacillus organovorans]